MNDTVNSWNDLKKEIDLAEEAGRFLPLWWRDDDATQDTPALSQLYTYSAPIILAVIPALRPPDYSDAPPPSLVTSADTGSSAGRSL